MAYDESLAERVRERIEARADMDEKRMFGGLAFLVAGNMACGVHGDDLIVRVDPATAEELLGSEQGARPMDLTGRPMRGWLLVEPGALAEDADLDRWVGRGVGFAETLPPK